MSSGCSVCRALVDMRYCAIQLYLFSDPDGTCLRYSTFSSTHAVSASVCCAQAPDAFVDVIGHDRARRGLHLRRRSRPSRNLRLWTAKLAALRWRRIREGKRVSTIRFPTVTLSVK